MISRRFLRSAAGQWLAAVSCYAVLVAPFGCQFQSLLLGDDLDEVLTTSTAGMFINDDLSDPLLIAGRTEAGDAYFVHGTRDANGNLAEIESILIEQANGDESFVTFESGRPVHVQGPDGSFAHMTYIEVSASRLSADVELFNAADASRQTYIIDVDLEQVAAQVAEAVRQLTGRLVETPVVPTADTAKANQRSVRIGIFSPLFLLFVIPFAAIVTTTVVILGQIVNAIFQAISDAVRAVLLAIFSPLFLIGELVNNTIVRVRFVPLGELFAALPPRPVAGGS